MELPSENVQDYPRPPRLEPVPQRITVRLGGLVIVDTTRAFRVLETHHAPTYYIPPDDVSAQMRNAPGRSLCEWKGQARYWDVIAGGKTSARAAWSYTNPSSRFADLDGFFAFYCSLMEECTVGGVPATPQPGDFYGGWVTPNLTGIVKGDAATRHW
ncbi:MAG: DUF427 domain-containing protein [Pseudomonadota bacterium]